MPIQNIPTELSNWPADTVEQFRFLERLNSALWGRRFSYDLRVPKTVADAVTTSQILEVTTIPGGYLRGDSHARHLLAVQAQFSSLMAGSKVVALVVEGITLASATIDNSEVVTLSVDLVLDAASSALVVVGATTFVELAYNSTQSLTIEYQAQLSSADANSCRLNYINCQVMEYDEIAVG